MPTNFLNAHQIGPGITRFQRVLYWNFGFIAIANLVQTTTRPIISTGIDKAEARFLEKNFRGASSMVYLTIAIGVDKGEKEACRDRTRRQVVGGEGLKLVRVRWTMWQCAYHCDVKETQIGWGFHSRVSCRNWG